MPLSLESKFLMDSLRAAAGSNPEWPGPGVAERVDAGRLLSTAHFHGVVPLAYRAISTLDSTRVPEEILHRFRADVTVNTFRSLQLTGEMFKLLDALEAEGVNAVTFKGPTLSMQAYGDPCTRQPGDLDILVGEGDLEKACSVLSSQGYTDTSEVPHARNFLHTERRMAVDLHRYISGPIGFAGSKQLAIDPQSLLDRADYFFYHKRRLRTFRIEDLLLILCIHGAKHTWEKWIWLFDMHALIMRHPEIDWSQLSRRSQDLGVAEPVYLSLRLSQTICGTVLPPGSLKELGSGGGIERLVRPLHDEILQDPDPLRNEMRTYLLPFRTLGTLREKAAYSYWLLKRRITPTSADSNSLRLPPYLQFLYFLTRPLRLIYSYGANVAKYVVFRLGQSLRKDG